MGNFVGQKVGKSYWPVRPEIQQPGQAILRALGFEGFSCVEFKRDARDGVYKLMEVNGRQNLSSLLAVRCGINFPYITYQHALGGEIPSELVTRDFLEGMYWIDEEKDLFESFRSYGKERSSWHSYVEPYCQKKVFAVFSATDLLPTGKRLFDGALEGSWRLFVRILNRLFGKKQRTR